MPSTQYKFVSLSRLLEERLSGAENLYHLLTSSDRLTYIVCYHAVQLFNSSIRKFRSWFHNDTAHDFEISHAASIRPLMRLCVRCIASPIPEDSVSSEEDKKIIVCIMTTIRQLWTRR